MAWAKNIRRSEESRVLYDALGSIENPSAEPILLIEIKMQIEQLNLPLDDQRFLMQSQYYRDCVANGIKHKTGKGWIDNASGIEWTDVTINLHNGCQKVSYECEFCYADDLAGSRLGYNGSGDRPKVFGSGKDSSGEWIHASGKDRKGRFNVEYGRAILGDGQIKKAEDNNRKAIKNKSIVFSFTNSMGDVFEDNPAVDKVRPKLFDLIKRTPYIHWLILTKRPHRIAECLPPDWWDYDNGYGNVWLGTSVGAPEFVARFNEHLAKIPCAVRFVSHEPCFGSIHNELDFSKCDLVITGGESFKNQTDQKRRKLQGKVFDIQAARLMRQACTETGTVFFYKQDSALRSKTSKYLDGKTYQNLPMPRISRPLGKRIPLANKVSQS